jgi:hypothetical protein
MRWLKYRTVEDCGEAEQFTTIDEDYAARIIRRNFPNRSWTESEAITEFIMQFEAIYVHDPSMLRETTLQSAAERLLAACGKYLPKATRKAGCHPNMFQRMLAGKEVFPPTHVLKRLGLVREVRYYEAKTAVSDARHAVGHAVLQACRDDFGKGDSRSPAPVQEKGLDAGT